MLPNCCCRSATAKLFVNRIETDPRKSVFLVNLGFGEHGMFSLRECLAAGVAFARDTVRRCEVMRDEWPFDPPLRFAARQPSLARSRSGMLPIESGAEEHAALLQREVGAALTAHRIAVQYQPVVSLATGRVIRFEALPIYEDHQFGRVTPERLIDLAEKMALTTELDDQLLTQACQNARRWPKEITLAVRVSSVQMQDSALDKKIFTALGNSCFSPERLQLELPEAALVEPTEIVRTTVNLLRRGGVKVALDDFGAGYASLSQLLSFQFDRIKIDHRFVDRLGTDSDSGIIVRAIIKLANEFGISVTAKGVETVEQLSWLIASGCQEAQGHRFGDAVPAGQVPAVLNRIHAVARL